MIHPDTQITRAAKSIRARCLASGQPRAKLARGAQMHPNSLRNLYQDHWDPALSTLARLEAYLNEMKVPHAPVAPPGRPSARA